MKKKILSVLCCCIFILGLSGCQKQGYNVVKINDEEITFDDTHKTLEEKFGNFYSEEEGYDEDEKYITILDDKDGDVFIDTYNNNILLMRINSDKASVNNLSLKSTIDDLSESFEKDPKEIGNNSDFMILYDDNNEVLKTISSDSKIIESEGIDLREDDDLDILYALKNTSSLKKLITQSNYAVYVAIEKGEVSSLDIYNLSEFNEHYDYYSEICEDDYDVW